MYYINIKGYGGELGTITLAVDTQGAADDPCTGTAATLTQASSVISFAPDGGTLDDESCNWLVSCPQANQVVTVTIQRFSTEQDYDFVNLYDGRDQSATQVAQLTGSLRDLPQSTYISSSSSMLIAFTSDASIGAEGFEVNYNCAAPPAVPPPPPAALVFTPITPGNGLIQGSVDSDAGAWFIFDAIAGDTYQIETQADTLADTMMDLVDVDGQTTLVENDDDTRTSGSLASYIEWTCPTSGTYYISVRGYGGDQGSFEVSISAASQDNPCSGGVMMHETMATISFMPNGGTQNDQTCMWMISCPNPRMHIELSLSRFDTESYFDSVTLRDGSDTAAPELATLSGSLSDLPARDYSSTGSAMTVVFASDSSVTGLGFEGNYLCSSVAPPPPPVPPPPPAPSQHSFVDAMANGQPIPGSAVDADGVWYQFAATEGRTYELDTEVVSLTDTMMVLVDSDGTSTLAENDDDERVTGQLDSYIEWTCPTSGTYYVNVLGYSGATGSFTFAITETTAGGAGGGDPCAGGATMVEPLATISFTPNGGTLDNAACSWAINCPTGVPTLTLLRFDVERDYDFVNIYDSSQTPGAAPGACTAGAACMASLTGGLSLLPTAEYSAAGQAMTIVFSSDASVGAEGFEAQYVCGAPPAPGPPPGPQFAALQIDAPPVTAEVTDAEGVWFTFNAQQGSSYQLDTEAMALQDTVMDLVDVDQRTTIVENDDDTRVTGRLDSFIEWTCPASGTYYINIKGYGADTGTFSISVVQSDAGSGGDPCDGGSIMAEQAATISFMPAGGTLDNENCEWTIRCLGSRMGVHLNINRFSTEAAYDFVYVADGEGTNCGENDQNSCVATLSGAIDQLPQREYSSTGDSMVVSFVSDASVGDEGFQISYECVPLGGPAPPSSPAGNNPQPRLETMATSVAGMTTMQMVLELPGSIANIYSLFGDAGLASNLPPAFQVPSPFGSDIGGNNPLFFGAMPDAEFDSWLTIGITDGSNTNAISSIGVDFSSWMETNGISITDGAIFYMAPDDGPSGSVVVAQVTVPAGSSGTMNVAAQGRSSFGLPDWTHYDLTWTW